MEYKEFIKKIEAFQNCIEEKIPSDIDDYLEMIFSSMYRSVFLVYSITTNTLKISMEIRATIPLNDPVTTDQLYFKNQLENMISLFTYLLKLQEYDFIIDALPEGIWYATIDLQSNNIDQNVFNLLNINKNIL